MCFGPMALVSGAVGAMSGAAEYAASVDDYNAREKMWLENYDNSLAAGRDEQTQLLTKGFQEQQATSQKVEEYTRDQAEKASIAEVSAASSGVGGKGVQTLVGSIIAGASRNRYWAQENGKAAAQQITQELNGTVTTMKNRINSVARPNKPSAAGAVLKIVGGFVGGVS